jgi:hypothetical protein
MTLPRASRTRASRHAAGSPPWTTLLVGEPARVEAGAFGPVADRRQAGAEDVRDYVAGVADENGPVPQPRVAGALLDHLGVVVGGKEGCPLAAAWHRQPANEVGEPGVSGPL